MKISTILFALAALALTGGVNAQCSSAVTIHSNESLPAQDTCSWGAVSIAGNVYSNVAIYTFVADSATAAIELSGNSDMAIMLSDQCVADPNVLDVSTTSVDASLIPDGDTGYVFVFPADTANSDLCGPFDFNVNGILPVELQSFSAN